MIPKLNRTTPSGASFQKPGVTWGNKANLQVRALDTTTPNIMRIGNPDGQPSRKQFVYRAEPVRRYPDASIWENLTDAAR